MSVKIFPYNSGSESAKLLSEATGFKRLKREGSKWQPEPDDVVINWGSSSIPHPIINAKVLNDPVSVQVASNKLTYFGYCEGISESVNSGVVPYLPEWTTNEDEARIWLSEGATVVCREKLSGHSGDGIVIAETLSEPVSAPLYTKYFKKDSEFRVHICVGEVIDVQQKKRKMSVPDEEVDWRVRNLKGGFIYARENLDIPQAVLDAALAVHGVDPLDFGAYDICYNKAKNKAIVLEVNTAPGISGTTVEKYSNRFKELFDC